MYVYQIVHWPSQRAIPKCFFELRTVALIFIKKKKKKRKKEIPQSEYLEKNDLSMCCLTWQLFLTM